MAGSVGQADFVMPKYSLEAVATIPLSNRSGFQEGSPWGPGGRTSELTGRRPATAKSESASTAAPVERLVMPNAESYTCEVAIRA